MYKFIRDRLKKDSEGQLLDVLEEPSKKILIQFYNEHKLTELKNRFELYDYYTGVGTYRLLTFFCIRELDDSNEKIITFFESCKRPKDIPHYEDIINTIVLNLIASVFAEIILIAGVKGIKFVCSEINKNNINSHFKEISNEYEDGINYLFRGRLLRKIYYEKQISISEHDRSLGELKRIYYEHSQMWSTSIEIGEKLGKSAGQEGFGSTRMYDTILSDIVKLICRETKDDEYEKLFKEFSSIRKG
jgi:hypothetical protein